MLTLVLVNAHEVWKIGTFLVRKNCAVQQMLKAGVWSSQATFLAFYLLDVTYRYKDTFSIGLAPTSEEVV